MPVGKEILDLGRSLWIHLQGKETLKVPLSGLTLESHHLQWANKALKEDSTSYIEEGPIHEFEMAFAGYIGVKESYSFSSGRVALSAILEAMNIPSGSKIMVCGFTCVAVANAILFHGCQPLFFDIELETYGGAIDDIQRKFEGEKEVSAIIIQHTFGLLGNQLVETLKWAKEKGIPVIEDACHAMGAKLEGQNVGTLGDAAFFSLERSKCISTFQGGMAVSLSPQISAALKRFQEGLPFPTPNRIQHLLRQFIFTYRLQRSNKRWYMRIPLLITAKGEYIPGNIPEEMQHKKPKDYALRLCAPLAKIGLDQLQHLDEWNEIRRQKASEWAFWAKTKGFVHPTPSKENYAVYLRYPIMVPQGMKDDLSWGEDLGVEVGSWYVSHLHPTRSPLNNEITLCPNARLAIERCVNLPTNLAYK